MDMKQTDEIHLVKKAKSGDTDAMKALYQQNIEFLTAVCLRYLPEHEDARDILQDSFIKIFNSFNRFEYRGIGSVRAWMTKVVVNETLCHLRANHKDEVIQYTDNIPDMEDDMDNADICMVPTEELRGMIRRLPYLYRVVFNLHVFSEMSHKEIGRTIGVAEKTSSSALCRAKKMLGKMIRDYLIINRYNNE